MVEELERVFTIPLKITKQIPKTKRAPRAIKEIKEFVRKHMAQKGKAAEEEEQKDVWVDYRLNELIWSRASRILRARSESRPSGSKTDS